ncbi:hypothetical protein [Lysobacter capsici]|uniref:hypothetical protein n=1 Tax=Lysobacter capsici TaxID=435897 RepID=UPI001BFFDDF1|nr:hypothetical protein [Lysobacter capsici]QWF15858.1 hypothetical protein KME82_19055 [Lysobacter capsici]
MSEHLIALRAFLAAMADLPRDGEAAGTLRFALLLKLGLLDVVEKEFIAIPDREAAWRMMSAATESVHGHGHVYTQHGVSESLRHSLSADRKKQVMQLVADLLARISQEFGVPTYLTSGTLLGLVREGDLIAHDDDVDCAYVSRAEHYLDWALEWRALTDFINAQPGYRAQQHLPGLLHITADITGGGFRFDLFSSLIENNYVNEFPLDVGKLRSSDVEPTRNVEFVGVQVPIPNQPQALLEVNYGPGWRQPDPSFRFDWNRADVAYRGRLLAMSEFTPTLPWFRECLPLVCGRAAAHPDSDFTWYKIKSIEYCLRDLAPGSQVMIFGLRNPRFVDWCARSCENLGLTLWLADLDQPLDAPFASLNAGDDFVLRDILTTHRHRDSLLVADAGTIAQRLSRSSANLDAVFMHTGTRQRTVDAYGAIRAALAERCSIVFDDMLLESSGVLQSGQYAAVTGAGLDEQRSFRAIGRSNWSQVIFATRRGQHAAHLI